MLDAQSVEKLRDIFRAALDYENGRDVSALRQADEPRWDSLMHVSLVAAIEGEFDVIIDVADSLRITSFQSAMEVLEEQLR
jgi:acyl carrier protein